MVCAGDHIGCNLCGVNVQRHTNTEKIMSQQSKTATRLQLIFLALLFLGPIVLATYFYKERDSWEFGSVQKGKLLENPLQLEQVQLTDAIDGNYVYDQYRGKWLLIYIAPSVCKGDCDQNLYKMRQVRKALGKDMERVSRVVIDTTPPMSAHLKRLLSEVYRNTPALYTATYPKGLQPGHIYIADPIGNVIMEFAPDSSAKNILSDMKRLLKISQIG